MTNYSAQASPNPYYAKCGIITIDQYFSRAEAVFTGEVIDIRKSAIRDEIKFKVTESWKGDVQPELVVMVSNIVISEAIRFKVGKSYLVFANSYEGKFHTGGCTGTHEFSNRYKRDTIKQLEKLKTQRKN